MEIAVIGTGYVGLVTGAVFADLGNDVICVDNDAVKVQRLNQGIMPIFEPGLEEMVRRNHLDGRLKFTTDLLQAVRSAEIIFIAVPTPSGGDGKSDLTAVEKVAHEIALAMNGYKVVVNKSTVPVGTGDLVRKIIAERKVWAGDFDVVSNPEFLREGLAIQDTLKPERIVIGAPSRSVAMKLLELYSPLGCPMLVTDVQSAEIIKYASNAFLATKISFINMIADLCEKTGADVVQVSKAMGLDSRIGPAFLNAGLGFGGSCFPKDLVSLTYTLRQQGVDPGVLEAVYSINQRRVEALAEKIKLELGGFQDKVIGVLGLAFKPDTDDIRDAKAIELCQRLLKGGAVVQAYDPQAMDKARAVLPEVRYCENAYEVAAGADALVVVTEWNEFRFMNLEKVRDVMRQPLLFDARNIYNPDRQRKLGFRYFAIGRGEMGA